MNLNNVSLTPDQLAQIREEIRKGSLANSAYESFIKDFIKSKNDTLFQAFKEIPIDKPDALMESKRLSMVIDQLEKEILLIIETGNLAARSLASYEEVKQNENR